MMQQPKAWNFKKPSYNIQQKAFVPSRRNPSVTHFIADVRASTTIVLALAEWSEIFPSDVGE
jgi:hypothetical protein